jgi:1,2-dihydroxy-3-keto-5-methylthiopentene dioxygenase
MAALVTFDAQGRWGDTLVCEARVREALREHGLDADCAGTEVLQVRGGLGLFYLRTATGYLGLLCEAPDRVVLPAGAQPLEVVDARTPFDARRRPGRSRVIRSSLVLAITPAHLSIQLPAIDAFLDHLIALTGNEPD